jgi:AcrR family transcriptional regulator
MGRTSDKRTRLIRSADNLILRQGYKQTTLADIARDSGVPLGNVYYYFKTKEDIAKTVIDTRLSSMEQLLAECSKADDPRERLLAFLDFPLQRRQEIAEHGCPLGTLSYEISRSDSALTPAAKDLIHVTLDWCTRQFEAMGKPDAEALALQLVTNLQGMSLVANALDQPEVIDQVVKHTRDWIQAL